MPQPLVDISTLIESTPGVYGGKPRLARSGLPIIQLVADYRSGMRLAGFHGAYPHTHDKSLRAGLAYYFAIRGTLVAWLDSPQAPRTARSHAPRRNHRSSPALPLRGRG